MISTRADAVAALPQCTDKAIAALQSFAERDATAMSDLARAYTLRAQWQDRPEDLLLAFDAAEHAVNARPQPKEAQKNLEAIRQSLSLNRVYSRATPKPPDPFDARLQAQARATNIAGLAAIEEEARKNGHTVLAAQIISMRGFKLLFDESRYIESLSEYRKALAIYEQLHDADGITKTRSRIVGLLRVMGQTESSWREALQTLSHAQALPTREWNLLLGETAAAANALGHPGAALAYADALVHTIQKQLAETPPEDSGAIGDLQTNLGIAVRRRATYEVGTGEYRAAKADLQEAIRLMQKEEKPEFRRSLESRIMEVEAQASMRGDPLHAVDAFTSALTLSEGLEYRSFRASLYAQRAEAENRVNRPDAAERDLRAALAELNAEEASLLAHRSIADADDIVWSSYFSRFQETYHLLIRDLVDRNNAAEAFAYADRARAFELLKLASKLTPSDAPTVNLAQIQYVLPRGTFLIEYTILDDRTYAWVISQAEWQLLKLPAGRTKIEGWSRTLQQAAPVHDADSFEGALFAAYDALLTAPMAAIAHMRDSQAPRLVIVPDGAMYGIPFAALHNPGTRHYLMQDAPVELAGSSALYALSVERDRQLPPDVSALLIGNPQPLHPLPGAEDEVKRVRDFYAPHATMRTGTEATIDDFVAQAREHAIVHVAAHAIADPRRPSHSALMFASGPLDASTLLTRLQPGKTRLVVLGACSSAEGPLVRPLVARGVPAVVGSLWDVDDATAEELLVSFHQHYREGDDAAVAMQRAQLDLLRSKNDLLRSVLAWAPFQVIGHGSSPFAAPRH